MEVDEENCVKGLVVYRGPGWQWGGQDGGDGNIGVVLRKFYVNVNISHSSTERMGKMCFAQVRWEITGCIHTYRIGTFGVDDESGTPMVSQSDLCLAENQEDPRAEMLKVQFEYRRRYPQIEDISTLNLDYLHSETLDLEEILCRFFRPRQNIISEMKAVSKILQDCIVPMHEYEWASCDLCGDSFAHAENCDTEIYCTHLPCHCR
mmetsp:Transcript_45374/g.120680  ORF Transcript_45374/g.120680 Transcript_45374/m.120680 type:complete len:206 (+) Transcript_45374:6-623(+)